MTSSELVRIVQEGLTGAADPAKAGPMAAYMKTEMPFYGVQKAGRTKVLRPLVKQFPPGQQAAYEENVLALWNLPHREEKYLALGYARAFPAFIRTASLSLYRRLIVEGAWWDFVDEAATKLVGAVLLNEREETTPLIDEWIHSDDLWLRRTSIICQLGHKGDTDTELLSRACEANLDDRDFFIRKAIGWAMREHAKTDPAWVLAWVEAHDDSISSLSRREAVRNIVA